MTKSGAAQAVLDDRPGCAALTVSEFATTPSRSAEVEAIAAEKEAIDESRMMRRGLLVRADCGSVATARAAASLVVHQLRRSRLRWLVPSAPRAPLRAVDNLVLRPRRRAGGPDSCSGLDPGGDRRLARCELLRTGSSPTRVRLSGRVSCVMSFSSSATSSPSTAIVRAAGRRVKRHTPPAAARAAASSISRRLRPILQLEGDWASPIAPGPGRGRSSPAPSDPRRCGVPLAGHWSRRPRFRLPSNSRRASRSPST